MNRSRLLCALALTGALITFPVISPVWAAPRPVRPTGRVAGGIAAPGSHRSRRESLPSPGSSHPSVSQ